MINSPFKYKVKAIISRYENGLLIKNEVKAIIIIMRKFDFKDETCYSNGERGHIASMVSATYINGK